MTAIDTNVKIEIDETGETGETGETRNDVGLALAADLVWQETDDETLFFAAGDVALRDVDMVADAAGDALAGMIGDTDGMDDVLVGVRAAWREIPASKRTGAWSKATKGKPAALIFPSGKDVKRVLSAILGYAEGVDSPMPDTGAKAPAMIGKIRSSIRPLVPQFEGVDSYQETVRLLGDTDAEKVEARVMIGDTFYRVHRPGPARGGPWIEASAFSKACAPWTITGKPLKIGKVGILAPTPTGNGWKVARFLNVAKCLQLLAEAGVVKATMLPAVKDTQRPAIVVPAVAGKHYGAKKAALDSDIARRVIRSITDAVGGKVSAEQSLFTEIEQGGSARGALTSAGLESEATTADAVNFSRGLSAKLSDWE